MNSEWLDVQSFKLLPQTELPQGINRDQILELANSYSPADHIIGTAKFISELKDSNAGDYWQHEFQYTASSYVTEYDKQLLRRTGAIVLYTDLRILLFYFNDVFSNAPLKLGVKSNNEISEVNFSTMSLGVL